MIFPGRVKYVPKKYAHGFETLFRLKTAKASRILVTRFFVRETYLSECLFSMEINLIEHLDMFRPVKTKTLGLRAVLTEATEILRLPAALLKNFLGCS